MMLNNCCKVSKHAQETEITKMLFLYNHRNNEKNKVSNRCMQMTKIYVGLLKMKFWNVNGRD